MEWKPIETAPRDRTSVLLLGRGERHADGFWEPKAHNGTGAWIWTYIYCEPTHWMPLPQRPNVKVTGAPPTDASKEQQTKPDDGASVSTAMLGVGSLIAIVWGNSCCTARVKAETEQRYLVKMDWGGESLMDIAELRRRKFVLIPERPSFWRRWLAPNVALWPVLLAVKVAALDRRCKHTPRPGERWAFMDKQDGPWPSKEYAPVVILEVRDGWVRYEMSGFKDQRMKLDLFERMYRPAA